jgi:NADPH-dependent 2,4-dienoyl-CoA reductase/sulfur reductase-like enzyme
LKRSGRRGNQNEELANMQRRIVVVGGGPAGVFAAIAASRQDAEAGVTLLTAEASEPYEKPPLSKAVLLDKAKPEDAPIAGPGGLAAHGVKVVFDERCDAIDRAAREVVTARGRLPYDALVLATGSLMRELPVLPVGMPGVHYLRTDVDARSLKAALAGSRAVVVVGGGLIGLEVAAAAVERGLQVTVVEAAPRVMMRACDEETSAWILAEHRRRGVDVRLGAAVAAVSRQSDGRLALETGSGEVLVADHIVVGAGVRPNDVLAAAAGLAVDDGILIDEQCRTSDPTIYAAGDCTRFPGPAGLVRLENWRHAIDQGEVAGRNAAGAADAYAPVPSYWSEQYDLYIQGVGWPDSNAVRVRRPLPGSSALLLELQNDAIGHAVGINVPRDLAAVRRLIERKMPVDPAVLADPERSLAALLKARA